MDSPLFKFLEWFEEVPIRHQIKLTHFISRTVGSLDDLSAAQMGTMEKYNTEKIKRFINGIKGIGEKIHKQVRSPFKWEGVKLLLSLRSQIDFLLNHPDYYDDYGFEGGIIDFLQDGSSANIHEICEKWDLYKNKYATDEYIEKWISTN